MFDENNKPLEIAPTELNPNLEVEIHNKLNSLVEKIVKELNIMHIEVSARRKATKSNFNLFTVLLNISDETRLHSRYIGHLLDPAAKHDCGALFLESFIESLKIDELRNFDCKAATVKLEKAFGNGRIDILIESPHWGAIAIENKIWAGEQSEQLERYDKFLEDKYRRHSRKTLLLFLTLDGRKSNTAGNIKYSQISYKAHIAAWISYCLKETYKYININQALQQYQMVIKRLTGGPMMDEQDEIKKIIKSNPKIILYIEEINQQKEKMKSDWLKTFWHRFKEKLPKVVGNNTVITDDVIKTSKRIIFGNSDQFEYNGKNIHFIFRVSRWNEKPNLLRVVTGLHQYNDCCKNIYDHFGRFTQLNEKIREAFPDDYTGEDQNEYVPSSLPLINNFANDEYLAEKLNIWDSGEGDKLIDSLCNKIKVFVDVVNEGIKEMSEVQK